MSKRLLFESVRVVFDADGMAHAHIGPHGAWEHWNINLITITTTSTLATSFRFYRGGVETPSNLIDVSRFNGNDDVSDSRVHLHPSESILGVWEGGTPGAIGTLIVSGESVHGTHSIAGISGMM